jgi:hypothetical protein
MGFNKRIFEYASIKKYAESFEYSDFKRYMTNPDSCIFNDIESQKIWTEFSNGNETTRQSIYKNLRNEIR